MNMKPTKQALNAARAAGTARLLIEMAGSRANIASNKSDHGKNAAKNFNRRIRALCHIPAAVALFEIGGK